MRRWGKIIIVIGLWLAQLDIVHAEPDYSDMAYWNQICTKDVLSESERTSCTAYSQYLASQNNDLGKQLQEVEAQRQAAYSDISTYQSQIEGYQNQIKDVQVKIDAKQAEIDAKQAEIDAKQAEIDQKVAEIAKTEQEIEELNNKIKARMENQQPTMRTSAYVDILMGASSFDAFIRLVNGFGAIAKSDKENIDHLIELKDQLVIQRQQLEEAKAQLEKAKAELEEQKQQLVDEQSQLLVLQESIRVLLDKAQQRAAQLEGSIAAINQNIEATRQLMNSIASKLDTVVSSGSWTTPVSGAVRSAGTWNYPGGGVHLGYDFAAPIGTTIRAVGNGVVLQSANGCPTYGYLGNTCGYQYGGSSSGGNQVYLLTVIDGSLYAVKYLHMMINSPISTGTVVSAGDYVGKVGTSGNSSGPHCHVEIFYLGDGSNFSSYARNWNGDLSFGTGWAYGSYGTYGRRCDQGYGAPCRIRPETVF